MLSSPTPSTPVPEAEPAPRAAQRAGWRWAALATLFALGVGLQGARGLYDPDEGRYAAVAVQMVRSGDWFTPRLNDELPHFTKPPLTYWVLASSMELLGENEWALRLPIALAFAATVLLTWGIARRLVPGDPLVPALVQATSLLPLVACNLVTSDPLILLWETLGVFAFVALWWDRARWGPLLLWTAFGLAFLTKGPPALLPLLAILVFAAWAGGRAGLGRLVSPSGFGLFVLLAFGWFALQALVRPDLLPYLLGDEVAGRVTGEHLRNPGWRGLVKTYAPVMLLGLFPWIAFAGRRPERSAGASPPGAGRFLLLWLLVPLAVFFTAQSRLPLYLLPLTVPGALLIGRRLAGWRPRWAAPAFAVWVVALLALEAGAAVYAHPRDGRRFAREVAAVLSQRPSEVVFVDEKPRWSLGVYLGCKVESVEVLEDLRDREGPAYRPVSETLPGELEEHEAGAVYLVPATSVALWRQELESRGWTVRHQGEVGKLVVFTTEPPASLPGADDLASASAPIPAAGQS
jgi:4-amino-4-deoxy-L-arabinose transferase